VDLAPFYFAAPELFLIPVEHLSASGMSDAHAAALESRGLVPSGFRAMFDEAFRRLWSALSVLAKAAPEAFPPPRLINVAVFTDRTRMHPYFQPFEGMSVLVFADDFDPATSSVEHAAYQLLVAERLGQTRRASVATMAALPYLLLLDDDGANNFIEGARRSARPDAEAARLIADHLADLRSSTLCEGVGFTGSPPAGYLRAKGTSLAFRREFLPSLQPVVKTLDAIAERVVSVYYEAQAARGGGASPEDELCKFLREARPQVLVVSESGDILWDPDAPLETERVRERARGIGDRPARGLMDDLRLVAGVSERFLRHVRGAREFRIPTFLEAAGGVYLHYERRLIAYALEQPGIMPLREEAPPYHRLLLEARAMHEWGHVAVEAGVVRVPPHRRRDLEAARADIAAIFARVVNGLPADVQPLVDDELRAIRGEGTRLEDLPLARIEDYGANVLVRRLLSPESLHAYARANVRSRAAEDIGLLRKLARYAFEVQYLWLAGLEDPWSYFLASTYFREEYISAGVIHEDTARALVDAVGRACACHELDESYITDGS
jgi:hypothetical protein